MGLGANDFSHNPLTAGLQVIFHPPSLTPTLTDYNPSIKRYIIMRGYTPVLFLIITPLLAAPVPDLGLKAHLQNVKNNVENFFDPNRA